MVQQLAAATHNDEDGANRHDLQPISRAEEKRQFAAAMRLSKVCTIQYQKVSSF